MTLLTDRWRGHTSQTRPDDQPPGRRARQAPSPSPTPPRYPCTKVSSPCLLQIPPDSPCKLKPSGPFARADHLGSLLVAALSSLRKAFSVHCLPSTRRPMTHAPIGNAKAQKRHYQRRQLAHLHNHLSEGLPLLHGIRRFAVLYGSSLSLTHRSTTVSLGDLSRS